MHDTLAPGTLLRERYEILALIGRGGMGAVYKAKDRRLPGRICALKEIRPPPGIGSEALAQAREQFLREASTLARLDHPNLPKVSDYFSLDLSQEEAGTPRDYLVMDYVPGQDLEQVLQAAQREHRFLDQQQVLGWMAALCDALAYVHDQQPPVLHRDVKPSNVKLTPDGRIKLVDFGLVKPLDPEDPKTLTGLRGIGSLPYTPIEQYAGELGHTDVRSDLYSLGATLYHLSTNRTPASAQERFLDPESLVAPRRLNPNLSPALEQAILAAMTLHPRERPASVSAWSHLLLGEAGAAAPPALPKVSVWGRALRDDWWLVVIAFATIVVAILLAFR
jgi:serine/threonine protein kinase